MPSGRARAVRGWGVRGWRWGALRETTRLAQWSETHAVIHSFYHVCSYEDRDEEAADT